MSSTTSSNNTAISGNTISSMHQKTVLSSSSSSSMSGVKKTPHYLGNNPSSLPFNDKLSVAMHSSETYADANWSHSGYAAMEELRRLGKLCDITLVAQGERFSAHRVVLAASVPYFSAMFAHDYLVEARQDCVVLNQVVDACALEHIINYSYSGKIEINNENVQSLLIAANFFHLKSIKMACCEFVKKRLCVQDALCLRAFAEQLMCHDLVIAVNRFINNNFSKIIQTNEFLNLSAGELCELLNRDDLSVDSEEQVYESLVRWVKHDAEKREKHFYELLQLVRLPLVGPTYLVESIANEPIVKTNIKCRDLLDEAIYYHLLPEKRAHYKTFNLKPRCCDDSFGLIYSVGGISASGGSVSVVEVYDCLNDKWRFTDPSMNLTRSRVAVAVLQGRLYAVGGYNGLERLATVEYFDTAETTKKWLKVCSISKPRSALGLAVLNNRLYVCGGYDGFASCDIVEMYDPKQDKWKILASMRKHRSASGITAFNSMIYAAGGHDGYRIYDSVECYDTQKDQWSYVASMKTKRCRLGLAALNGKLYAAGGYDSLNFLNSVERYCPLDDKWEFVASMNLKRSRLALVTCNSKLYAIGGYDGSQNLCSVEAYDPDKDKWVLVASMQSNQGVVGVGVLPFELDLCNAYEMSIVAGGGGGQFMPVQPPASPAPQQQQHQQLPQQIDQKQQQQQQHKRERGSVDSTSSKSSSSSASLTSSSSSSIMPAAKRVLPSTSAATTASTATVIMNNYYSLMEDEDDENTSAPAATVAAASSAGIINVSLRTNSAASTSSSSSSSSSSITAAVATNANTNNNTSTNMNTNTSTNANKLSSQQK